MSEVVHGPREHLSQYFDGIAPDARLLTRDDPEYSVLATSTAVSHSTGGTVRLRAVSEVARPIDARGIAALGALAGGQYDADLTFPIEALRGYQAIAERLDGRQGEMIMVLLDTTELGSQSPSVEVYSGILTDELRIAGDYARNAINEHISFGRQDLVAVDSSSAFSMNVEDGIVVRTENLKDHRGGLPVSRVNNRHDSSRNFSLIDGRDFSDGFEDIRTKEAARGFGRKNVDQRLPAVLLTEEEIAPFIVANYDSTMASELILELARDYQGESPDKIKEIFGNIPELSTIFKHKRAMVEDFKAFYGSRFVTRTSLFEADDVKHESDGPMYLPDEQIEEMFKKRLGRYQDDPKGSTLSVVTTNELRNNGFLHEFNSAEYMRGYTLHDDGNHYSDYWCHKMPAREKVQGAVLARYFAQCEKELATLDLLTLTDVNARQLAA